ncbi:MAG: TIGR03862 family flavoprotein [Pseudomonadales bacterium]
MSPARVAVVGSGPAGLAAAEALGGQAEVHVFEAMPSMGRKFLLAGRSGLNLTHGEALETFLTRFGAARSVLERALRAFPPQAIRHWADELGIDTFVGSSGRVFPTTMKTSPLLRAWLARLTDAGVQTHVRHLWQGWEPDGALTFTTPQGRRTFDAAATVLALGGASWPRLGSTGRWHSLLEARGVAVRPLRPANCGFDVTWSSHFRNRFAGSPLKSVRLTFAGLSLPGDLVITETGIEGSSVYALSGALRDAISAQGAATLVVDLIPDRSGARLTEALSRPRGKTTFSNWLRKATGMNPVKIALLREAFDLSADPSPAAIAAAIKSLPLILERPRPIAEAISSAGGIALSEINQHFMLRKLPGVFVAGEMLDWEAPTGGYLLTACLATGRAAGAGVVEWLQRTADAAPPPGRGA